MIKITTEKLSEILDGELVGNGDITLSNISTDSRKPCQDGIFFALKGENFNGHRYVNDAIEQGCRALVVEKLCKISEDAQVAQIIVKNSKLALGKLAKWLKFTLSPQTAAITGSSGKTTVKEMTAAILQQTAHRLGLNNDAVLFTQGNFNNDIGVPLTLLRLTEQTKFAVIELGANHLKEIAYTTKIANPDIAVINNFAHAHLEGFGSLQGVAKAKGEIFLGLKENGTAVINLDCQDLPLWQKNIADREIQSFSIKDPQADYFADDILLLAQGTTFNLHTPAGDMEIYLPYAGMHNVSNALAATALAMKLGANLNDVKQGLHQRMQVKGRLYFEDINDHLTLIDDTYNANVSSMKAAISVLKQQSGFRILVLGDMGELGENSTTCHQQVGEFAKNAQLDCVFTLGEKSQSIAKICGGKAFFNLEDMMAFLIPFVQSKCQQQKVTLLAKGSRSMHMENVISSLKDNLSC
ncbi:UDP-N-acetylmuramoyl-tripeptide--D-alanyl-D-alanine ligase [Actinobacillus delphinicola]|uniref:UDP-N-acetylmuramoyl-tripeptide--D-alanyl-D-alanine ligase n=1 Tax=Actinobacillus delphinicola TaxID=51161 RepID=A0A448TUD3_9PAST|nr:UDP-N-acetylmuramoyl-tripeptide--D-alanyl-D-alanine ligase [Actinobacillus delphinicola]VEJ09610.1 UDP-N-acetylmuramoylalanyl-D-glutamyl-2, 6-diaminopimelate--D-alanyl-D-alanyl ligase [Actinobacillus delphinicola]